MKGEGRRDVKVKVRSGKGGKATDGRGVAQEEGLQRVDREACRLGDRGSQVEFLLFGGVGCGVCACVGDVGADEDEGDGVH